LRTRIEQDEKLGARVSWGGVWGWMEGKLRSAPRGRILGENPEQLVGAKKVARLREIVGKVAGCDTARKK
jgi:hypothetical protein